MVLFTLFVVSIPGDAARDRVCSVRVPAWAVVTLSLVDVLECPEYVVIPDKLLFRFFCFFDNLRSQVVVVAEPDDPGSTEGEYGGGFSRAR